MPKKVKGYNKEGESQWFIGGLPEGWYKKPVEKEVDDMTQPPTQEVKEEPKKRGRPPMKDKE